MFMLPADLMNKEKYIINASAAKRLALDRLQRSTDSLAGFWDE